MMRIAIALLLLLGADEASREALSWGRDHTEMFFEADDELLWDNFSTQMQSVFGQMESVQMFRDQVGAQLGAEVAIIDESVTEAAGSFTYNRTSRFEKTAEQLIQLLWSFDADGVVIGFQVTPVREPFPSQFLDYQTKTKLHLPFDEEWYVVWGGRTLKQNYHAFTRDQRFAYDILMMKGGATHQGDGKKNEDYYCFGKKLLAPAAGKVVSVANDVIDNVPGELNPKQALGNHVILDHGNGEFSFLAHLQKGTVQVELNQAVTAGDFLGLCGNSGNTTEPHLHYHLQNSADFNNGDGLPAYFVNFRVDDQAVERTELVQGQRVAPGNPQ
jgi:hypothetical protein